MAKAGWLQLLPPELRAQAQAALEKERPAGSELFEERLQLAAAVPPERRPPDVEAFLRCSTLVDQLCVVLPIAQAGSSAAAQTALPGPGQLELALARLVTAEYANPCHQLLHSRPFGSHLLVYMEHSRSMQLSAGQAPPAAKGTAWLVVREEGDWLPGFTSGSP